jgi:predicted transcriptional regulator
MRSDQLDETTRGASRNHAGSDADLRDIEKYRQDCARDIARAFQSGQGKSSSKDLQLMRQILETLEDLADGLQVPDRQGAGRGAAPAEVPQSPPIPPHETIGLGFLVCLEDGRICRDLGRHLSARHGLSPIQYRRRWGLPPGYPMTPPASHQERLAWRRRLAPEADAADRSPPIWLNDERGREATGRTRRPHRRGAPAGLRHDRVKARAKADRRSAEPRNDGSRP